MVYRKDQNFAYALHRYARFLIIWVYKPKVQTGKLPTSDTTTYSSEAASGHQDTIVPLNNTEKNYNITCEETKYLVCIKPRHIML